MLLAETPWHRGQAETVQCPFHDWGRNAARFPQLLAEATRRRYQAEAVGDACRLRAEASPRSWCCSSLRGTRRPWHGARCSARPARRPPMSDRFSTPPPCSVPALAACWSRWGQQAVLPKAAMDTALTYHDTGPLPVLHLLMVKAHS